MRASEFFSTEEREKEFKKNKRTIDEIGGVKIFKTNSHTPVSAKFIGVSPVGVVFSETADNIVMRIQFLDFVQRSAKGGGA